MNDEPMLDTGKRLTESELVKIRWLSQMHPEEAESVFKSACRRLGLEGWPYYFAGVSIMKPAEVAP